MNEFDSYEKVMLGDVALHYAERGAGSPVVLVHGSLADAWYWEWSGQLARLATRHRVIAYSRRYNHPNANDPAENHSAHVEADDLRGLLDALGLGRVHLVGHSYGAYTALLLALAHPERLATLTLAEPPIMGWLGDLPGGERFAGFMDKVWKPLGDAFRNEGDEAGLEFTSRWFFGVPFADAPETWKPLYARNVREWRALALSADPFPPVDPEAVSRLRVPTLLLSGEQSAKGYNDLIDERLEALLPDAERVVVKGAGHEMFLDNPDACAEAMARHFQGLRSQDWRESD